MAVLSKEIYSPQNFIETLTGKCYFFDTEKSVLEQIYSLLFLNGCINLQDCSLTEINHIVENNLDVVLVDVSDFDDMKDMWVKEYRWFEVPASCRYNFENKDI